MLTCYRLLIIHSFVYVLLNRKITFIIREKKYFKSCANILFHLFKFVWDFDSLVVGKGLGLCEVKHAVGQRKIMHNIRTHLLLNVRVNESIMNSSQLALHYQPVGSLLREIDQIHITWNGKTDKLINHCSMNGKPSNIISRRSNFICFTWTTCIYI